MSDTSKAVGREILGRKENAQRRTIHVPEWDGDVIVQQLTYRQVVAIQALAQEAVNSSTAQIKDRGKLSRFNFAMIRDSWITADGEQVLSDDDYEMLVGEPNNVIKLLVTEISDFNGMDPTATANAKKNSGMSQNGDSGSS